MTNKTVKLSHKLVISNEEDAKPYKIESWYIEYFKELNAQLSFLGVEDGETTIFQRQVEINHGLNTIFNSQFAYALDTIKPFVDLNGVALQIESVQLVSKTFIRNAVTPVLFIFLTTKPLELVESFSSMMVLKNPITSDGNPLLTVELNRSTTLTSIKE